MFKGIFVAGPAQDDARENRLIDLFNLAQAPGRVRHGTDAILNLDGHEYEFELKSITTKRGGISTVRDLGPDHIAKWRNKHWIMAYFEGQKLLFCRYGSPEAMRPWIEEKWNYIKERARYVIERGSTLNNPHISDAFLSSWPRIDQDHAAQLRRLVRDYRASRPL